MLSSSSCSAHAFRASLLKCTVCSSCPSLSHGRFTRFLSNESISEKEPHSSKSEPLQSREEGYPFLTLVQAGKNKGPRSMSMADEGSGQSSHFSKAKKEMTQRSVSQARTLPASSFSLRSLKRKGLKQKAKSPRSQPSADKTSTRKLQRDLKTLRELVSNALEKHGATGLKPESWKEEWGEDTLKPTTEDISLKKHASTKLPSYNRRIEGIIRTSNKDVLEEIVPPEGKVPIARLAHGLERVLFNPGVHWLQDPRSRVYNFTPYIQNVPDVRDFAFERLTPFIRSSRDTVMRNLTISHGKRFAGSTSSLSGLLCHIYFLLSQDREVNLSSLPEPFSSARGRFTPAQRMPSAVLFNHQDGVYLIDSDSTDNDDGQLNILLWMGTMLENFFTLPKDAFSRLLRSECPENAFDIQPQAYRYSQSESFVMRSQLDCVDPRLPGSGVFDIKTRAALPLRMDNLNFEENSGYLIKSQHGFLNSFDREYYDLIRSAFLKYSFQVRIGGMDGIFLAYHNTARVFGLQYVPLEELDDRLFGDYKYKKARGATDASHTSGTELGWNIFSKCVHMLEVIAAEIVECFPGETVTCLAETREGTGIMHIWIQPVDEAREKETEDEEIPMVKTDSDKPIVQLDITARSFLGGVRAVGPETVFLSRKPWSVHWSISRSSLPVKTIRQNLAAAKKRKYRPKAYPTGINAGNLQEFIKNLGFGNHDSPVNAAHFIEPPSSIKLLRKISRAGHLESQKLQLQDEAKGIQILQAPELIDPESIEISQSTTAVDEQKCLSTEVRPESSAP